ncbi:MAG: phosphoribosylformylglycinamidine synthase subunit PurS [Thermaurantimonas sp.]|uniref:phosphoribosylformylglycinamidine synthase subunit PurS n=1 Tax=Thermaurantimonas sp. TaxID=2681568 RepID=UPI00391D0115
MKFRVEVNVMPHRSLLDPQGKAVCNNLPNLGITGVEEVRIGKHIQLELEAASEEEAREKAEISCKKILANPITEYYEFTIHPLN